MCGLKRRFMMEKYESEYNSLRCTFGAIYAVGTRYKDSYHIAFAKQIYHNRQYFDYIARALASISHFVLAKYIIINQNSSTDIKSIPLFFNFYQQAMV